MKTLYIDCGMGAAGDMLTAALLELLPDPDAFLAELNALGLPGVEYVRESSVKCGITGTHVSVRIHGREEGDHPHHDHDHGHSHHHEHSDLDSIRHTVDHLPLSPRVRADIRAVFGLIAQAESHVHQVPLDQIHFHEVGTLDAVADVTAVCLLLDRLAPDQIIASPVHVGSGQVECAHGVLPVPAPATAYILRDVPIYGGSLWGELCTPTGAALLKHFVTRFGDMPALRTRAIGYGMGSKDFPAANCLRVLLGESEDLTDRICQLSCNVDDMTAEAIGFAMERLFEAGAREVYTLPAGMKKNRPGTVLTVLCAPEDRSAVLSALFRHTATIGVRETEARRYVLARREETLETPWGPVGVKKAEGYGVRREKLEYEDLARIARERNLSLEEVRAMVRGTRAEGKADEP